jgi:hypothetical protein
MQGTADHGQPLCVQCKLLRILSIAGGCARSSQINFL